MNRSPITQPSNVLRESIPADLVLQRQCFGLELAPVIPRQIGTYVHFRCLLLVRMAELENDLRLL
jgi:hypothetical protein